MNGYTQYYYDLISRPSKRITINKDHSPLVEATKEGMQAPHEHVSVYDLPAHYQHQEPDYQQSGSSHDQYVDLGGTTPPLVFREARPLEIQSQPESYQGVPMEQAFFDQLMKVSMDATMKPMGMQDTIPINPIPMDRGMMPMDIEPAQLDLEAMIQDTPLTQEFMASDMIHAEIQHQMHEPQVHFDDMMQSAYAEHAHAFDQHIQNMEDQFMMQQQLFDMQMTGPFG